MPLKFVSVRVVFDVPFVPSGLENGISVSQFPSAKRYFLDRTFKTAADTGLLAESAVAREARGFAADVIYSGLIVRDADRKGEDRMIPKTDIVSVFVSGVKHSGEVDDQDDFQKFYHARPIVISGS